MSLATPQGFHANPSLVWQFYHYRRETALKAQPNAAHLALAALTVPSIRQSIAPDSTFTLITQNVDNLSPRANDQVFAEHGETLPNDPRSPYLIEMHGKLFDILCTNRQCRHRTFDTTSPICKGLAGTETLVEQQVLDPHIPLEDLPRCQKCGSLARPGVVWFGEKPHHMSIIDDIVDAAGLCLVVGTSSTVYPAAGYASVVQGLGGKVAVFNYERTDGDDEADFRFIGGCEDLLPEALGLKQ